MWRIVGVILLSWVCPLASPADGLATEFSFDPPRGVTGRERHIRFSFTLTNERNTPATNGSFWVHAPVRRSSSQHCLRIGTSRPAELIQDEAGNNILRFPIDLLPPYGAEVIVIKADLLMNEHMDPVEGEAIQPYLDPEAKIQSNHEDIMVQASRFLSELPQETVTNVYTWIKKNVQDVGFTSRDFGALWALRHRKGDCTEMADLFVAFCRAVGVPARIIDGYMCTGNTIARVSDYHNWAEYYDGEFWHVVDPQQGVFINGGSGYVATRISLPGAKSPLEAWRRFHVEADGVKAEMN
ncbi:MAG: transglutaminase-like domain-containing protein [Verrucomicrobia bacterium]|nr:transglutaminase-like domain-containing protein [Verrucomicrobiota bacterium]